jgi:3'-phosphoadenosine 5'-phosphosulfate sulfotransferase (PAPS reductase)/FAD synthetase
LPVTFPGIDLDENNYCQFCREESSRAPLVEKTELLKHIKAKAERGEYDCVVPLSGGKDSTLVLYYSKKVLGLNPLAVNYDSSFQSKLAKQNIKKSCDTLNVPLVIKPGNNKIQIKILREVLLISEIIGKFIQTCINCEMMLRTVALEVAHEHGVPFILWGSSSAESTSRASYENYRHGRSFPEVMKSKIRAYRELQLSLTQTFRLMYRFLRFYYLSIPQKLKMNVPFKFVIKPFGARPFPERNPEVIHLFDYIPWDPEEAARILKKEMGWDHPDEQQSRFDCLLYCFAQHKSLSINGITKGGIINNNLIRRGLLSREKALQLEEKARRSTIKECQSMLLELGLENYKFPGPKS